MRAVPDLSHQLSYDVPPGGPPEPVPVVVHAPRHVGATTLEWTLPSPPPHHQFTTLPVIEADAPH